MAGAQLKVTLLWSCITTAVVGYNCSWTCSAATCMSPSCVDCHECSAEGRTYVVGDDSVSWRCDIPPCALCPVCCRLMAVVVALTVRLILVRVTVMPKLPVRAMAAASR
jgi:hypothetical protein